MNRWKKKINHKMIDLKQVILVITISVDGLTINNIRDYQAEEKKLFTYQLYVVSINNKDG